MKMLLLISLLLFLTLLGLCGCGSTDQLTKVDAGSADAADAGSGPFWTLIGERLWPAQEAACTTETTRSAPCVLPGQDILLFGGAPLVPAGAFNEPTIEGRSVVISPNRRFAKITGGAGCSHFGISLRTVRVYECK